MSWQPTEVLYPDAELVLTTATRAVMTDQAGLYVGRTVPATVGTAIIWNRIGGNDPTALMQARVYAPDNHAANALAGLLTSRLMRAVDGKPIQQIDTAGYADLGTDQQPMRQLLFDITFRGAQQ